MWLTITHVTDNHSWDWQSLMGFTIIHGIHNHLEFELDQIQNRPEVQNFSFNSLTLHVLEIKSRSRSQSVRMVCKKNCNMQVVAIEMEMASHHNTDDNTDSQFFFKQLKITKSKQHNCQWISTNILMTPPSKKKNTTKNTQKLLEYGK